MIFASVRWQFRRIPSIQNYLWKRQNNLNLEKDAEELKEKVDVMYADNVKTEEITSTKEHDSMAKRTGYEF